MNASIPVDSSTLPSERGNPLEEYSDEKFLSEFRMRRDGVVYVCGLIKDDMKRREYSNW